MLEEHEKKKSSLYSVYQALTTTSCRYSKYGTQRDPTLQLVQPELAAFSLYSTVCVCMCACVRVCNSICSICFSLYITFKCAESDIQRRRTCAAYSSFRHSFKDVQLDIRYEVKDVTWEVCLSKTNCVTLNQKYFIDPRMGIGFRYSCTAKNRNLQAQRMRIIQNINMEKCTSYATQGTVNMCANRKCYCSVELLQRSDSYKCQRCRAEDKF